MLPKFPEEAIRPMFAPQFQPGLCEPANHSGTRGVGYTHTAVAYQLRAAGFSSGNGLTAMPPSPLQPPFGSIYHTHAVGFSLRAFGFCSSLDSSPTPVTGTEDAIAGTDDSTTGQTDDPSTKRRDHGGQHGPEYSYLRLC